MRLYTPFFIFGLIIFIIQFLGIPDLFEKYIIAFIGISIMLMSTFANFVQSENKILFSDNSKNKLDSKNPLDSYREKDLEEKNNLEIFNNEKHD
jgi:hypothetical protein